MFSNQIAEIVHGVCNEFHGAPNKNTGETFLVIWKQHEDAGRWSDGPFFHWFFHWFSLFFMKENDET